MLNPVSDEVLGEVVPVGSFQTAFLASGKFAASSPTTTLYGGGVGLVPLFGAGVELDLLPKHIYATGMLRPDPPPTAAVPIGSIRKELRPARVELTRLRSFAEPSSITGASGGSAGGGGAGAGGAGCDGFEPVHIRGQSLFFILIFHDSREVFDHLIGTAHTVIVAKLPIPRDGSRECEP